MLVKRYTAKKEKGKNSTCLGKCFSVMSKLRDELSINSEEDIEGLVSELERLLNQISNCQKQIRSMLGLKLLEKRILSLEDTIDNVNMLEECFRQEANSLEDSLEDDEEDDEEYDENNKIDGDEYDERYIDLTERTEEDIVDCLYL